MRFRVLACAEDDEYVKNQTKLNLTVIEIKPKISVKAHFLLSSRCKTKIDELAWLLLKNILDVLK